MTASEFREESAMKTVNKRQRTTGMIFSCLVFALLLVGGLCDYSSAQEEEEFMKVRLGLVDPPPGNRYLLNPSTPEADPIMAVVTIETCNWWCII